MLFFGVYVLIKQIYIPLCTHVLDVFFPLYFHVIFFIFLYVFTCFSEGMSIFLVSNFLTSKIKESNVLYRFRTWILRLGVIPGRRMGRWLKIILSFNFEQFICDQWERALPIY